MKKAIVFSGQGSQFTNMGKEFLTSHMVEIANKVLGYDVLEILENKNNELNDTYYTQPMIALVSIAIYDKCKAYIDADAFLGFSLGEYVALYASGIYDFETILKIVKKRSELMQKASVGNKGKMAAVINLDETIIKNICDSISEQLNEVLVIANYNSKNQIVISGTYDAIELASQKLKEAGAKRVITLNVSGAFHSPLMKQAGKELKEYLSRIPQITTTKSVYLNTTAMPLNQNELLERLEEQIQSPVYFYQSIEQMIKDGYTHFIEMGPGTVLSQLIKKNYPEVMVNNIEKIEDFINLRG
ncbi:Malonyl CoA-(acyl-carrier-protein) transacylase [Alteracholeplasma palmae J233]|uniref:Malonyl CoA-acyl carrier protein transacylase n=1 Tax=Alteracholeplasma palmae (strain ATCC 49389 / J233) TaxID=1318466 RepID=U4KQJ1_ALTPJ|nr:ACP S-malonyltransferase [Alteracholeplasma palmae]CCV64670.1 Malonyl CoA-(acyl-carrier-protein) transacylase [Alteracholeplasma palmae J233]